MIKQIHPRNLEQFSRSRGQLSFSAERQLEISACFQQSQPRQFHLSSFCTFTQIPMEWAIGQGLKGHSRLLGRSTLADGTMKIDYLTPTTLNILGVEVPLVFKVAPRQEPVIGLDAMWIFNMKLTLSSLSYEISTPFNESQFRFLVFEDLLQREGLTSSDLCPLSDLPPPQESYQKMVDEGQMEVAVDVGSARFSVPTRHHAFQHILDLGFS